MAFTRSARAILRVADDWNRVAEQRGPVARLRRKVIRLRHQFWSMVTASDVVLGARLGRGVKLPHPTGVVIHQCAEIGEDCMIMQQVTIGQIGEGAPRLGRDVYVGAGAKVIGSIEIGDGARIGANAVVLVDVPPGFTAVGVPARLIAPRNPG